MPPKRRKTITIARAPQHTWEDGALVWGKFAQKWWCGMIITMTNQDENTNMPEGNHQLFWFGDHHVSKVTSSGIIDFKENYKPVVMARFKKSNKTWQKGVGEALQEFYQRSDIFSAEEVLDLANNGLPENSTRTNAVPEWINELLNKAKTQLAAEIVDEKDSKGSCSPEIKELIKNSIKKSQPIKVCMGCYCSATDEPIPHPLFQGYCCTLCKERIRDTLSIKGDDGICYYCAICGFPGELIICENSCCGRVYCKVCISDLAAPNAWETYCENDDWNCFICCDNVELNGVIFRQQDYLDRIQQLFASDGSQLVPVPRKLSSQKQLRVLSLFDGIATGLQVLDVLNIPVDKYYSCEVDLDSINIAKLNFGDRITQLGDIMNLDERQIEAISHIDLVLAGSPCNELSLANPFRKGLYDLSGSGHLFFEFYRVIHLLKKHNPNGFFWIFENVASMPLRFKATISRYLQSQPALVDAAWLSPQCRPRLFWGNLPYLYQHVPVVDTSLQDYLLPGRTALVNRIRTVTTKSNSLKQGTEAYHPVMDSNERPDTLWIIELEKIFGFPIHYTDTGNLSVTQRQQALGKAWSVQTVTFLLRFLKEIYPNRPVSGGLPSKKSRLL